MNRIQVTFLGSGDAFSSGGRLHTCIHVRSESCQFLIDCGASALIGMKKFQVHPNDIELIFLSHLHGDHFGGIPFFLIDAQLVNKRTTPLTIAGPPGTKERILEAMEVFFRGSTKVKQKFNLKVIEFQLDAYNHFDDMTVTPYEVNHPSGDPSLALRIEHLGRIISYTGDTEWVDNLLPAAKNADLFISECYLYDKKVKYHMDYQSLASHFDEIQAKKIILTHMSDDMLQREQVFGCDYAEDGKRFFIG